YPCTWVESDGKILIDDGNGSLPYTLQPDGTLLGQDESGDSMTFARAAATTATTTTTTTMTTTATDSAAGTWKLVKAEADGIIVTDTSTLGISVDLQLNTDGTGMLTTSEGAGTCTWTQSGATVTVAVIDGGLLSLTLQSDGTLSWLVDDVMLYLSRTNGAAIASTPAVSSPLASGMIESEYGFRVQLPTGWVAIDSEYIEQIVASVGEAIASASGFNQDLLDLLAAANTSLYYSPDMTANFNVVREPAGSVTMDNFLLLESSYQQMLTSQGITDFKLSGPVDINGNPYYVGTFTAQAGLTQKQYFCVANGYIYTITLTNVSDSDAEQIMASFETL
ncbi:MAG TPA: hypothetical protein IAC36_08060, partial [Candidatus Aphodomonas merdavium]|nr:hypothetical protein [Candidatus Aphodomonas merdavium]